MSCSQEDNRNDSEIGRIARFSISGSVGFAIDAVLLYLFSSMTNPYMARLGSFFFATAATWKLNTSFTFRREGKGYIPYIAGQSIGIAINYLTYLAALALLPQHQLSLLLALGFGSTSAMAFNYLSMKKWLFN